MSDQIAKIEQANNKTAAGRKFHGVVTSDKMNKTITVRVEQVKVHPKYGKRYKASKKFKVHDEKNQYKEGDKVSFVECRPLSKDKRWRVIYERVSRMDANEANE